MPGYLYKNKTDIEYYLIWASRPLPKNKFSKYRGVQKNNNPDKPYRVAIRFKARQHIIGTFTDEIAAAKAYNEAALRIIGEAARPLLNEIPETTEQHGNK
jgi:hypothetical protein